MIKRNYGCLKLILKVLNKRGAREKDVDGRRRLMLSILVLLEVEHAKSYEISLSC